MNTRLILEGIRDVLKEHFGSRLHVVFDGIDDSANARDGLTVITLSNPKTRNYMDGNSDSTIYIYVHHTSRFECKLLREDICAFLDDTYVNGVRAFNVEDEREFIGVLGDTKLKAERAKFELLY